MGLVGTHPTFDWVRQYVFSRGAYRRLETIDDVHLRMGLVSGDIKSRDVDEFWQRRPWPGRPAEPSRSSTSSESWTRLAERTHVPQERPCSRGHGIASEHGVDLTELARSIIAQVSQAHADSSTGRVWFPAEAIRTLCRMEFLVASELSDPRLDDAFLRSSAGADRTKQRRDWVIGQQVIEERGLTPSSKR